MARIVILGAGPAGSAAGLGLARAGHAVTIFERAEFPRVKVCGEFISPAVTSRLEAVVPPSEFLAAGARRVGAFTLELADRELRWPLPAPAWALSRAALDALLLSKASNAGVTVRQPANVTSVEYAESRIIVTATGPGELSEADVSSASRSEAWRNLGPGFQDRSVARSPGRSLLRVEADIVIHGDGSGRHDPAGPTPNDPRLIGHKCHLRVPPVIASAMVGVRMRVGDGCYLGTISVEGGLATCALVAHKALIARHRADADSMVREVWPAFDPAWRVSDWKACGVPRSTYITPGHPRSFRLGNAAAAVDPVGGEGIGLAIWSAMELSSLLNRGNRRDEFHVGLLRSVQREFGSAYRRRLQTRLPACRLAAEACMRPGLVRAMWPLLARPWVSIAPWYRLTGKPA